MKRQAVVIGGGLAGLAAAYELSKSGMFQVTLLEVEPEIGGRAHTKLINETAVDFGGFIIYPWYKQFHQYIEDFGLEKKLVAIPSLPIFYDLKGDGNYIQEIAHPYRPFSPWRFLRHVVIPALLFQNPTYPHLDAFKRKTVHELLHVCQKNPKTVSDLENYFNIVSQGYCYGALDDYKAVFGIPAIAKSKLFGDIRKSVYLKEGLRVLTTTLAREIKKEGGIIRVNAPVTHVDIEKKQVQLEHETLEADIIVYAQPYGRLIQAALKDTENACAYTHFAVVTARFNKTPSVKGKPDWGSVFYKRQEKNQIQILSSINLATLYGPELEGHVNLNVRFNHPSLFPIKEDLFEILHDDLCALFPDATPLDVVESQFWTNTMPVANETLVERVRNAQGVDDLFYAGDYLGCPSMETALSTGVHAAKLAIAKYR